MTDIFNSIQGAERLRAIEWSPPELYNPNELRSNPRLEQLHRLGAIIQVRDSMEIVAEELFKIAKPAGSSNPSEQEAFLKDYTGSESNYGKWVYFPWSGALIRYPEPQDHLMLRTARNRNLVTQEEQRQLFDSRIAVLGLSVGSNIVETLARSGIGNAYAIGDPDTISPTNLNRISASFKDVGKSKLSHSAIKLSELDPFIEQAHFTDGITPNNISLLEDFNPDIIFDEMDNLEAKAQIRLMARRMGVPLVMVTDFGEKTLIDIERYDDKKTIPFQGKLKPDEFNRLSEGRATNEEIGRFMVKILGLKHVSVRLLDSFLENGVSLSGIPQLGSTASLGGSAAALVSKEIILGNALHSGRYVVNPRRSLRLQKQSSPDDALRTFQKYIKSKAH